MNILHLTSHLNSGGITSYLLSLMPQQKRMGAHLCLWGKTGDRLKDFQAVADEVFETVPRCKSELSPRLWLALPGLLTVLKQQSIDLMHAHTRTTQVLAEAAFRITKIPYVTTAHGFYQHRIGRKLFPCWGKAIFAISHAVRDGLMDTFKASHLPLIKVVPNGIDIEKIQLAMHQLDRKKIREEYGCGEGDCVVISASRLRPSKGIHFLISAFALAVKNRPELKLLIAGGGDEGYLKKLKNQVKTADLESRVRFLGNVTEVERPFRAADIFVAPNLSPEGFGLSMLEAMAAAVPLAASRTAGARELLQGGEYGLLFEEEDVTGMARAIEDYAANPLLRRRIAEKALAASNNYSSYRMAESIQETYQEITESKNV